MEYKKILELIREMNQTDLTKLEIEEEGFRLCLEKEAVKPAKEISARLTTGEGKAPATALGEQEPVIIGNTSSDFQLEEAAGSKVLSPMVGTFYTAASPEKPPFVKVGDWVKKGQTLCIIEAMKLLNEIESDYEGEVVKILVGNEQMVEFGQPLFLIR